MEDDDGQAAAKAEKVPAVKKAPTDPQTAKAMALFDELKIKARPARLRSDVGDHGT